MLLGKCSQWGVYEDLVGGISYHIIHIIHITLSLEIIHEVISEKGILEGISKRIIERICGELSVEILSDILECIFGQFPKKNPSRDTRNTRWNSCISIFCILACGPCDGIFKGIFGRISRKSLK